MSGVGQAHLLSEAVHRPSDCILKDKPFSFPVATCLIETVGSYSLQMSFYTHLLPHPPGQILHTDVVYLHCGQGFREAEKIKRLLLNFNCNTVVIGNGTACRETEAYFADLIMKNYFAPLDVVYCIVSEAGASIYSVSPEANKEMPGLDPNLRSAVSIARRVQDPLAELVKFDPKHIGVGMYQ